MNLCRVAIVADDLTGALDAAAPFAARGARTRVVVALEHLEGLLDAWQDAIPEVIAVNTDSRHLTAEQAAERVTRATTLLERVSPRGWFKKIDSTLRGQVVAECLAMREVSGRHLLLSPAVPAQGRIVRDAEVLVRGEPLATTVYGEDARAAPPLGPLDELFAAQGLPLVRSRIRPGTPLPTRDCVADAETDTDLAHLYDAALAHADDWLMAGAAGLARAVAQRLFGRLRARQKRLLDVSSCLYVVGSQTPLAREQVERLLDTAPSLSISEALGPAPEGPHGKAGVVIPGGSRGEQHEPETVARAIAARVAVILHEWPPSPGLLFLTGGEVAMAVLVHLGITFIEVDAEWAPGVAVGLLEADVNRRVMTKAGGFGEPDLLARLHACLALDEGSLHQGSHHPMV
jgi:uncharacterized protein YgbK (DUF1537 family)